MIEPGGPYDKPSQNLGALDFSNALFTAPRIVDWQNPTNPINYLPETNFTNIFYKDWALMAEKLAFLGPLSPWYYVTQKVQGVERNPKVPFGNEVEQAIGTYANQYGITEPADIQRLAHITNFLGAFATQRTPEYSGSTEDQHTVYNTLQTMFSNTAYPITNNLFAYLGWHIQDYLNDPSRSSNNYAYIVQKVLYDLFPEYNKLYAQDINQQGFRFQDQKAFARAILTRAYNDANRLPTIYDLYSNYSRSLQSQHTSPSHTVGSSPSQQVKMAEPHLDKPSKLIVDYEHKISETEVRVREEAEKWLTKIRFHGFHGKYAPYSKFEYGGLYGSFRLIGFGYKNKTTMLGEQDQLNRTYKLPTSIYGSFGFSSFMERKIDEIKSKTHADPGLRNPWNLIYQRVQKNPIHQANIVQLITELAPDDNRRTDTENVNFDDFYVFTLPMIAQATDRGMQIAELRFVMSTEEGNKLINGLRDKSITPNVIYQIFASLYPDCATASPAENGRSPRFPKPSKDEVMSIIESPQTDRIITKEMAQTVQFS